MNGSEFRISYLNVYFHLQFLFTNNLDILPNCNGDSAAYISAELTISNTPKIVSN
jgi:hypothetical protein